MARPRSPSLSPSGGRRPDVGAIGRGPSASAWRRLWLLLTCVAGCGGEPPNLEMALLSDGGVAGGPPAADCPAPLANADAASVMAWREVNRFRRAAGLSCLTLSPVMSRAAENHCKYYGATANRGKCIANPHKEVKGCELFTGETFADRLKAVSYGGKPGYEVMAYVGSGDDAVVQWIDSIWHRLPLFHPTVSELGYGRAGRCDTMDFATTGKAPEKKLVVYPYDGQGDVPAAFSGRESPDPPRPPDGWPSGYPVTIYAGGAKLTEHTITVDGTNQPLFHIWLGPGYPGTQGILSDEYILYTYKPLAPRTRYRVRVAGKRGGDPVAHEWTFTTR